MSIARGVVEIVEIEAQIDAVAPRPVAARPAGNFNKTAAGEEAGRVRMGVDRDVTRALLRLGHMAQAVLQQLTAKAGAMAVGTHEAENQRGQVVERRNFVAAERQHLLLRACSLDDDEKRSVGVVEARAQPAFFGCGEMVGHICAKCREDLLAVGGAIAADPCFHADNGSRLQGGP